uniref:Polysaccharide pyruvyl transferase domain-containing protein n=1 Tax=viral metagenome TaxID=1070528 RepID=A0A6C0BN66_9ZZZZ
MPPHWFKIHSLLEALREGCWDAVILNDADLLTQRRCPPVTKYLEAQPNKHIFAAMGITNRPNSGYIAARTTSESQKFFQDMLTRRAMNKDVPKKFWATGGRRHYDDNSFFIFFYHQRKHLFYILHWIWNNNRDPNRRDYNRHYCCRVGRTLKNVKKMKPIPPKPRHPPRLPTPVKPIHQQPPTPAPVKPVPRTPVRQQPPTPAPVKTVSHTPVRQQPPPELKCMPPGQNWGDNISVFMFKKLSKRGTCRQLSCFGQGQHPNYLTIGSILRFADNNSIVWGTGFLFNTEPIGVRSWDRSPALHNKVFTKPAKVCAVRGKLTRKKLLSMGIACPEVYGDPALLFPMFYQPRVKKVYALGVIAHYKHREHATIQRFKKRPGVLVIDIFQTGVHKLRFIRQVLSCRYIVSSSLHGLVVADAYRIPNAWFIIPSSKALIGSFKFLDHFSAVGRGMRALRLTSRLNTSQIIAKIPKLPPPFNRQPLLQACPFYQP